MNTEELSVSDLEQEFVNAAMNSLLYGHGFIRITHNNGLIVSSVSIDEYPEISELMKFVSDNRIKFGEKNGLV